MKATAAAGFAVLAALCAGVASAVLMAIVLAAFDLYPGHAQPSLAGPWIDTAFVQLSRADALLLAVSGFAALVSGAAAYRSCRRRWPMRGRAARARARSARGSGPPRVRRS
jgi:hypothetical protein